MKILTNAIQLALFIMSTSLKGLKISPTVSSLFASGCHNKESTKHQEPKAKPPPPTITTCQKSRKIPSKVSVMFPTTGFDGYSFCLPLQVQTKQKKEGKTR